MLSKSCHERLFQIPIAIIQDAYIVKQIKQVDTLCASESTLEDYICLSLVWLYGGGFLSARTKAEVGVYIK